MPTLHGSASAGYAMGGQGYRLGTLEVAVGVKPGWLLSARYLVGSRPRMVCPSEDLHPDCSERGRLGVLLGGIQLAPSWHVVQPYVGAQLGSYRYHNPFSVETGRMAAAQVGLRLRLGSLGGAYADASFLTAGWGGVPFVGVGLNLDLGSLRE